MMNKYMRRLKKQIISIVAVIVIVSNTFPSYSLASTSEEGASKRVLQMIVPQEDGTIRTYTGDEAQALYEEMQEEEKNDENQVQLTSDVSEEDNDTSDESDDTSDEGKDQIQGMFRYKYRFVKKSSGTKNGKSRRISNYLKNRTSKTQSMTVTGSTTQKWTISANLTGKYKKVFLSSVGASWQLNCGFTESLTVKVPPKKRVWLEFQPKYKYIKGESQKYYVTRGTTKKKIIEHKESVYSTSPKKITMSLGGSNFQGPDGTYTWMQDNNYK